MTPEAQKEVQAWVKRNNRKCARLISYKDGVYDIVYFDKGKVRVGTVRDGMFSRYGIKCRGAMYSEDPMSLWQFEAGACTQADVDVMVAYLNDACSLPEFDFASIKEVRP